MKRIVIVGGKLQGTEAAYLGREAGIEITLIDKSPMAPAQKLCTDFVCGDVLSDDPKVLKALEDADMILPTMENDDVLEGLERISKERGYVLAFDLDAYRITESKKASDRLFVECGIPCPRYYPEGQLPYFAKPDAESGSHGVRKFEEGESEALEAFASGEGKNYIIQEFVSGPSYSMEIIGRPGNYRTYEVTQIFVDEGYDCNLAAAYRTLEPEKVKTIAEYTVRIAEELGLKGIMDIEVIDTGSDDGQGIKVLEIDARIPSQTSAAVYHATGMNYMKELYDLFVYGDFRDPMEDRGIFASYYQHMKVNGEVLSPGEHVMTEGGLLAYDDSMLPAAMMITDRKPWEKEWRSVFISEAETLDELKKKEEDVWKSIQ